MAEGLSQGLAPAMRMGCSAGLFSAACVAYAAACSTLMPFCGRPAGERGTSGGPGGSVRIKRTLAHIIGDDVHGVPAQHLRGPASMQLQARPSRSPCPPALSVRPLPPHQQLVCRVFVLTLQRHLLHLVPPHQLQHAEAISVLGPKLGAVLLHRAHLKDDGGDARERARQGQRAGSKWRCSLDAQCCDRATSRQQLAPPATHGACAVANSPPPPRHAGSPPLAASQTR